MKKNIFLALFAILFSLSAAYAAPTMSGKETAVFAGGCFWCEETAFEGKPGVISVISGYTGGNVQNPTYEDVSSGRTGHAESVQVTFDPKKTSYAQLLKIFWVNADPTDSGGQFCDRGNQYRSEIFYANEDQKRQAEQSKQEVIRTKKFSEEIETPITSLKQFYPAEDYHQDFYKKNPIRYETDRIGCGRDSRLKELWGAAAAH